MEPKNEDHVSVQGTLEHCGERINKEGEEEVVEQKGQAEASALYLLQQSLDKRILI